MAEAVDKFNRKIDYLRLSVTDRCNLRCLYCMPEEGVDWKPHEEILSYEETLKVAKTAVSVGLTKIRLTGGEPLVRKGITDLVRELCKLKDLEDLSLTTNGLLLSRYANELAKAGLTRVNVSIDSLEPQTYKRITRGGELRKVLDGLETALRSGLQPIKVNVVAIRELRQNFKDFVKLAQDYPVHVRFIEYMPIGKRKSWKKRNYMPGEEIKASLTGAGLLEETEGPKGWGPARYFELTGAQGTVGFISPCSHVFCAQCNRLRITADGKLRTCLFSEEEIDLRPILRSGTSVKEIKQVFRKALATKPEERPSFGKPGRTMSEIGG